MITKKKGAETEKTSVKEEATEEWADEEDYIKSKDAKTQNEVRRKQKNEDKAAVELKRYREKNQRLDDTLKDKTKPYSRESERCKTRNAEDESDENEEKAEEKGKSKKCEKTKEKETAKEEDEKRSTFTQDEDIENEFVEDEPTLEKFEKAVKNHDGRLFITLAQAS